VAPWWANVSSFKNGVDGTTLWEHRQPFFVKESSSLAFVLPLSWCWLCASPWTQASSTHVRGYTSMLPQCGNVGFVTLMQNSSVALAAFAASPFLIEGMR